MTKKREQIQFTKREEKCVPVSQPEKDNRCAITAAGYPWYLSSRSFYSPTLVLIIRVKCMSQIVNELKFINRPIYYNLTNEIVFGIFAVNKLLIKIKVMQINVIVIILINTTKLVNC